MTGEELEKAEARYRRASARAETLRQARNAAVLEALAEGWTHAAISQATGLSRGRISQIKA
jgi:DNA-binding NarL/FixJ family response regulator